MLTFERPPSGHKG